MFLEEKELTKAILPLPRSPSFYLEVTIQGTGRGQNLREQGLDNVEDAVRPGSQGIWRVALVTFAVGDDALS